MNIEHLQQEVDKIVIASPCAAKWSEMDGTETIRFCGQCNKNVHNLSAMSPEQLAYTLELRKRQPTCVFMTKRKDGSVKIDNCPAVLRETRDRIRTYAAAALIILLFMASGANAQDSITVAPIPATQNHYSEAHIRLQNIAHLMTGSATAIAFVLALFVPRRKGRKTTIRQVLIDYIVLAMIPICAYFVGSWYIYDQTFMGS